MSVTTSNAITIKLKDSANVPDGKGVAYVAGYINGKASNIQVLSSNGTFVDPPSKTSVTVASTKGWQSTGISVDSTSSTIYTVSAISGKWTADPKTNNGELYDAEGCPGVLVPGDRTAFPMQHVQMGALVGKIGDNGTPFFIGTGNWSSNQSEASGVLHLAINDDLTGQYGSGLSDNSGSIKVDIAEGLSFYEMSKIKTVTLNASTNGNDRLIFVVSPAKPAQIPIAAQVPAGQTSAVLTPLGYTSYPYANSPGIAAPGPFDIFEFGMDAAADLSAVNGFGLNLSFTYGTQQYGVRKSVTRKQVGAAFTSFIKNEGGKASAYSELLYDDDIGDNSPKPPSVDGQFFAIADPNDMLEARVIQGKSHVTADSLSTYWDTTLNSFFTVDKYLSINLGDSTYNGKCTETTLPGTQTSCNAFTLSNGTNTYTFYQPPEGIESALYVFKQSFNKYTAGSGGDAGLLQDNIWEALCRGVALSGLFDEAKTGGESTAAWNKSTDWYPAETACHYFAKFMHYSDVDGKDSRSSKKDPIFHGHAAYGFSEDENPDGPGFSGNVPSKTTGNVPAGSTMTIELGPWN